MYVMTANGMRPDTQAPSPEGSSAQHGNERAYIQFIRLTPMSNLDEYMQAVLLLWVLPPKSPEGSGAQHGPGRAYKERPGDRDRYID